MTVRCTYCGTQDQCGCALEQRAKARAEKDLRAARQALGEIPGLFELLHLFVEPGVGVTGEGYTASSSPARPPINLGVLDLLDGREKADSEPTRTDAELDRLAGARRQGVLPTLASWVRLVDGELWDAGEDHQAPSEYTTVMSECGFLLTHIDWIGDQQWLGEFARDLAGIVRDLRDATHQPAPQRYSCTKCGWGVAESAALNGYVCTGCHEVWTVVEMHRMAERKKPRTLKQISDLIGISLTRLRVARNAHEFRPVARDGKAELFDLQEVAAAVQHLKYRTRRVSYTGVIPMC